MYVPRDHVLTTADKAVAAWLWSGRKATVAGVSAAALHGSLWLDASLPAELNRRSRDKSAGIVLPSDQLRDDETCSLRGIPATPARTAFDLGRRRGLATAVIRLDALMHATGLKHDDVEILVNRHRGARGIVGLRHALAFADAGAESPQQTRTRLILMDAGLPRPQTQIQVFDEFGYVTARIDTGWKEWHVGVEFDGAQHWTDPRQRSRDIDRIAELEGLGWTIIRVSGEMLRNRSRTVVERTRAALQAAGWSPTSS